MDRIELAVSDFEDTFLLIAEQHDDGIGGRIEQPVVGGRIASLFDRRRVDAFARTQYNPETRYATAGECLLALMRALFPALGIRA